MRLRTRSFLITSGETAAFHVEFGSLAVSAGERVTDIEFAVPFRETHGEESEREGSAA
jgi:hypothetical protein